jgi:MFS transporter, SET family, sugar efflux transporter
MLVQALGYRGTFLFCGLLALCALVLFAVPEESLYMVLRSIKRILFKGKR